MVSADTPVAAMRPPVLGICVAGIGGIDMGSRALSKDFQTATMSPPGTRHGADSAQRTAGSQNLARRKIPSELPKINFEYTE